MSEDWQPARIAPVKNAHGWESETELKRWSAAQGMRVNVRPMVGVSGTCLGQYVEVHPVDVETLTGVIERAGLDVCGNILCEHQILTD